VFGHVAIHFFLSFILEHRVPRGRECEAFLFFSHISNIRLNHVYPVSSLHLCGILAKVPNARIICATFPAFLEVGNFAEYFCFLEPCLNTLSEA